MAKAYLGLGSNLDNKESNLRLAIQKIEERIGKVISLSAFYETLPWGFISDNTFLNAALCVETNLLPQELLKTTQQIEREVGRTSKTAHGLYSDRLIDIDLLLYDDWVLQEGNLTIPHPMIQERCFVMTPLTEIAPELIHPVFNKTIRELHTTCSGTDPVIQPKTKE